MGEIKKFLNGIKSKVVSFLNDIKNEIVVVLNGIKSKVVSFLNDIKNEIVVVLNGISFFQYFVVASLTYVLYSPFLFYNFAIDGEIIYTAGFSIVFYLIWVELYSKPNDMLFPSVISADIASFWLKYKTIESDLVSLFYSKIALLNSVLITFSLTTIILKSLSFIKFNNSIYRISLQTLNILRLKNKSLPLQ
jgi:hypothetical protein